MERPIRLGVRTFEERFFPPVVPDSSEEQSGGRNQIKEALNTTTMGNGRYFLPYIIVS